MKVEVLNPHGLCAGVNAAIAKALSLKDVYCLHELVHNEIIVEELRTLGYRFVNDIEEVPEGASVVFSAHGVSPAVREAAARRNLKVFDTTCPYVGKVHESAKAFAKKGLPVVVIGNPNHVETIGIVGELGARGALAVVRNVEEAEKIATEAEKIGVVSQTTMDAGEVSQIVEALKKRFTVETMAEVCNVTKERQESVRNFKGDALIVLGSATSSNTRRLCEVAPCKVFMVGSMKELRALNLYGIKHLGVTSGASTPERFFDEAVKFLCNIPQHVAIIMDGNGRWAIERGKSRGEGHIAGARTLEKVIGWCGARGIRYLTVYAFSTENWKRPKEEVDSLMKLFAHMLKMRARILVKNKVRFRMIGRRGDLPPALLAAAERLEQLTAGFEREIIVAISYGGRAEIIDAINRIEGPVTEEIFRQYLYAPDVPDPDLVIRTSGELRLSNFLLWETAYSEFYFTDVYWPDFSEAELDKALEEYSGRHRRKGGV